MNSPSSAYSSWGAGPQTFNQGVQSGEVLAAARTHLNDDEGIIWPDQKLFPKLRVAHRMMQLALVQNGVPIISEVSSVISVPAYTTDLSTTINYPPNVVMPIWMKERMPGQLEQDFVDMTEVDYIPNINQSTELIWWTWNQQTILLVGSTNDREVKLRYRGGLWIPMESTDPVGPFWGELFLGFKTAALALGSVANASNQDRINSLEAQALGSLDNLLVTASLEAQNLPTKRRPYHRGRGRSRVLRDF